MTATAIPSDSEALTYRRGRPTLGHRYPQGTGRSPKRSARLPEALDHRLDAYLRAKGLRSSEVIRDALEQYLDQVEE